MNIIQIILFLFIFYIVNSFYIKNKNVSGKSIKGPLNFPFIGSLYKLSSKPHFDINHMSKQYGNTFSMYFGDQYTIVITDPLFLRKIFVENFDNFVERSHSPIFTKMTDNYRNLASGDEFHWKKYKGIISSSFSKQTLKNHVIGSIDGQVVALIEKFKEFAVSGEPVNPRKYLQRYTINIIMKYTMGIDIKFSEPLDSDLMKIISLIDTVFKQLGSANICDFVNVLKPFYQYYLFHSDQPVDHLFKFIDTHIDSHVSSFKQGENRDLMDFLIQEIGSSSENKREIRNIIDDLLVAGTDTSAGSLNWITIMLANYPDYQEKCYNEIKALNIDYVSVNRRVETPFTYSFIKEVMRIHPIGPLGLPRRAKEDIIVDDIFIPKHTQIIQNIYGLLNNEEFWDSPRSFKPERFLTDNHNNVFIPFGVGNRMCIGTSLAYDEIYACASNLILNFKIKPTTQDKLIDETELFGLTIHPNEYLVHLEKR